MRVIGNIFGLLRHPALVLIAGISCILMRIVGFFIPDVMGIEKRPKEINLNGAPEPS
jgi:hypothetical protein